MLRRFLVVGAAVLAAAPFLGLGGANENAARADAPAGPQYTCKIGTLAPKESPWGKVFTVWQKGFAARTNGQAEIQFFFNGTQGDENAMVGKIRTGQLDGAAVTAVGLGQIYKQVLTLQLPGLFSTWDKLDAARAKMKPTFDVEYEKAGFKNLGDGDVGAAYLMTKGFEVHTPKDLKHKGTFYIAGDPIMPMVYSLIGDVTPKSLTVPEITGALTSGSVQVVDAPCLAAEQLQWAPQLTHINTLVTGYAIGSLVFSVSKFNSLPADVQAALKDTGEITGKALTARIRGEDKAAYDRLAVGNPKASPPVPARMTAYSITDAEKAEWTKLFADARAKLKGATFNADIESQVEAAAK